MIKSHRITGSSRIDRSFFFSVFLLLLLLSSPSPSSREPFSSLHTAPSPPVPYPFSSPPKQPCSPGSSFFLSFFVVVIIIFHHRHPLPPSLPPHPTPSSSRNTTRHLPITIHHPGGFCSPQTLFLTPILPFSFVLLLLVVLPAYFTPISLVLWAEGRETNSQPRFNQKKRKGRKGSRPREREREKRGLPSFPFAPPRQSIRPFLPSSFLARIA